MANPKLSRKLLLVVAVALTLVVVAFGSASFYRRAQAFQPLGFTAIDEEGHWRVTAVTAAESPLEIGDQIILINGQGHGELADPRAALRLRKVSDLVVLREGRVENLSHRLPPLDIDYPYLILALIGVCYLLIGLYTLLRDQRRPAVVFFMWCLTSALLYLVSPTTPYDTFGRAAYLLDELARILLPALTLHLFTIFPQPLARNSRLSRIVPFIYLPSAFLLLLQIDLVFFNGAWLFGGSTPSAITVLDRLELFHLVLFSLAAVGVLSWRLRRTPAGEPLRQATWIAVGMVGGYLPFLILYVLPLTFDLAWPQIVTSVAVLFLALVPLTFAYAILRYKLWDIGVIVRDTASLSLTVLVGVIGFSLANLVINRAVPDDMSVARTLMSFTSGLVIAGLLIPTRKGIGSSLERLQYRSGYSRRRALSEFGREVLEQRSLARLCATLISRLRAGLRFGQATLLLTAGKKLMAVQPVRELPAELPFDAFDEDFWQSDVKTLSAVEFPTEELTVEHRLFGAGYRYAFPLVVRESTLGVLLVGYKEDGETPLNSDDLDLIRNLLTQAALAIENAQLLDEINLQLEEVVRLQRYSQDIIDSSPAGIAVVDPAGLVISANQAFAKLTDTENEEVAGRPLTELLPVDPLPKPGDGLHELHIRDRDGTERYLQLTVAPLAQGDTSESRVVVAQDVTERIAMENTLKEKERLASLGMLAAGVAHEVNTPITGISSYAQMLLADTAPEDPRRDLLEKVEKQTFRAARIVNSLLEFARDRQRDEGPVEVTSQLAECLELLKERIEENKIELVWKPPSDEILVMGNEGELQQVFSNLIVNAVDAIGAEGGRLEVALEAGDEWVWATFEDSGPGIPPAELDKIFQPFYSTKLGNGGTGLGLSISFNIARRHGGEIRVVSHPGEGSKFIVELPRYRPAATTG
jgi:two-component system NtrC family sensor kinase